MVVELTIFTQDNHTHVRQTSLDTDFRPPVWSGHELFPWTEHPCSTREGASCSTGGHTTVQNDMMPVLCFCLPERIIVCSWCLTSTRTFTPAAVKTSRISTHVGFSTACKKNKQKQKTWIICTLMLHGLSNKLDDLEMTSVTATQHNTISQYIMYMLTNQVYM